MPEVILIHGLWYRSWSMRPLGRYLEKAGFHCRYFNYPTWRRMPEESTSDLLSFCKTGKQKELHLVGHSLGGLLIMKMLEEVSGSPAGEMAPGRVVLLGSPLAGSSVAGRLARSGPGRLLLNHSKSNLVDGVDYIPGDRQCGMIAGNSPHGLGRLVGVLNGPNDGTVAVSETRPEKLTDHVILPLSHTGLLFSSDVAMQTAQFLKNGSFLH